MLLRNRKNFPISYVIEDIGAGHLAKRRKLSLGGNTADQIGYEPQKNRENNSDRCGGDASRP